MKKSFYLMMYCCLLLLVLGGCVGRDWKYKDSPYQLYMEGSYGANDRQSEEIRELVNDSRRNPPETYWVHWQIAKWAYKNKHYGTALFALNELDNYYKQINKGHYYRAFNVGVILYKIGLKDAARGRFEYVENNAGIFFLKNRSTAFLMAMDNGEDVEDDLYAYEYR